MKIDCIKAMVIVALALPLAARANPTEQAMKKAAEVGSPAGGELKTLAEKIAGKVKGCKALMGPLKKKDRIEQKAKSDYHGDVTQVWDMCRATVECPKNAEVLAAEHAIDHDKTIKVHRKKDKWTTPAQSHYRDFTYNITMSNGAICEIQINSEQMVKAKHEGGHAWYEFERKRGAEKAETPEEAQDKFADLVDTWITKESQALYDKAYEAGK